MKLRFQKDGTFKIMQITDMQEIPAISKDTIALMERAVLEEQPDLVVYTGDQIKGYGVTYKGKGEELEREVAQTIGKLLEPVTKRGIPFAVTLPKAPDVINADLMTDEQIYEKLQKGYDDMQAGRIQDAASAFAKFREKR